MGVIHHRLAQLFGQSRKALMKQLFFHRRFRIANFTENKSVGKGLILALGPLLQARVIAAAVGVGRGRETEHGVRGDQFAAVLRDAQG